MLVTSSKWVPDGRRLGYLPTVLGSTYTRVVVPGIYHGGSNTWPTVKREKKRMSERFRTGQQ